VSDYEITTHPVVLAMGKMHVTGNVVNPAWMQHLKFPKSGRPCAAAALILADVVYWYRPAEARDETTGAFLGWRKRFSGHLLQRDLADYERIYGLTPKQTRGALDVLESVGVVLRHIEPRIVTSKGKALYNVPYLVLVPERLAEISYPDSTQVLGGGALQGMGGCPTGQTYTKSTYTETTSLGASAQASPSQTSLFGTPPLEIVATNKGKGKRKPHTDPTLGHPVVQAHVARFNLTPSLSARRNIVTATTLEGGVPDVAGWDALCAEWSENGWSPVPTEATINRMIERYARVHRSSDSGAARFSEGDEMEDGGQRWRMVGGRWQIIAPASASPQQGAA
jgi:hypothetical protein